MCSVSSHHITHLPALSVANTNLTRLHTSAQLGPIHGRGTVHVSERAPVSFQRLKSLQWRTKLRWHLCILIIVFHRIQNVPEVQ